MGERRQHPDWFLPDEAAEYMRMPSKESLRSLEKNYGLVGVKGVTTYTLYHREDLDRCLMRIRGIDPDAGRKIQKPLRLSGGQGE